MSLKSLVAALGAKKPGDANPAASASAAGDVEFTAEQETAVSAALAAALAQGVAQGKTEGAKEGGKAMLDRFGAILGNEKVKGRETVALSLAMKSPEMSADDVVAFVEGLPAGASAQTIQERMNGQGADLALGGPMQAPQGGAAASQGWDKAIAKLPGGKAA